MLVEQNPLLDSFPADGTLSDLVSTHLAGAVTAQENHVLESVQAHWTHRLQINNKINYNLPIPLVRVERLKIPMPI